MSKLVTKGDAKLEAVAKEFADECEGEGTGADRCDNGLKFERCMHNGIKARNIDFEFL